MIKRPRKRNLKLARRLLTPCLGVILCSVLLAEAQADDNAVSSAPSASATSAAKPFRSYVTVAGIVNGSLIAEPKNKTLELDGKQYIAPYPGFGGVGGGGGLARGRKLRVSAAQARDGCLVCAVVLADRGGRVAAGSGDLVGSA